MGFGFDSIFGSVKDLGSGIIAPVSTIFSGPVPRASEVPQPVRNPIGFGEFENRQFQPQAPPQAIPMNPTATSTPVVLDTQWYKQPQNVMLMAALGIGVVLILK